jgi:hypothetical protein
MEIRVKKNAFSDIFLSCGGWTRTSDLQVMSLSPDSAEFHTKLVFLTCFRTCGVNEPEEL